MQATLDLISPGLWLGIFDGHPREPLELPLPANRQSLDIYFFVCGELEEGASALPEDSPMEILAGARPQLADWVFVGPARGAGIRLRLRTGGRLRAVLLRLLPAAAASLFGSNAEPVPARPGAGPTGAAEKQIFAPRCKLVGCSAAMKARLRRLYQNREPVGWRKVYRQSLALQLLYMLTRVCGASNPESAFLSEQDRQSLQAARRILDAGIASPPGLAELAARCELSEHKLKKGFKALYATTVYGYVTEQRMETARGLLAEDCLNVDAASWAVGYKNVSHFITAFRRHFGVNPGCYKRDLLERMSCSGAAPCDCPRQEGRFNCALKTPAWAADSITVEQYR